MKTTPFFTIGVPVYNTADFLGKCLDSILSQNFTDFEILCVNDGSVDNSLAVLNEYRAKDNRIRIISRPNGGVSSVRNTILTSAQGRYINMIDSDDYMVEGVLMQAYEKLTEENHPDVMYCGMGFTSLKSNDESETYEYHPVYPGDKYFSKNISKDERAVTLFLDKGYISSTGAKFVRSEFIRKNGLLFDLRYIYGEDSAFSILVNRKADSIIIADIITQYYQQHRDTSVTTTLSNKAFYTFLCFEFDLYGDCKFWDLTDETRSKLEIRRRRSVYNASQFLISKLSDNTTKNNIFECAEIVDNFIGGEVNPSVVPDDNKSLKNTIIYTRFKFLGVKTTMKLLYAIARVIR